VERDGYGLGAKHWWLCAEEMRATAETMHSKMSGDGTPHCARDRLLISGVNPGSEFLGDLR
jgi:hypothetical protein